MKNLTRRSFLGLLGKTAVVVAGASLIGPKAVAAIPKQEARDAVSIRTDYLPLGDPSPGPLVASSGYCHPEQMIPSPGDMFTVTGTASGYNGTYTVVSNNDGVISYV